MMPDSNRGLVAESQARLHQGSRGRARIGVLVPFTNTNLEADLAMLCPPGVTLHYARLGDYDEDEIPDEKQMAGLGDADLSEPLRLLMGTTSGLSTSSR